MSDRVIFLDLDGVLVDFVGGVRRLFPQLPEGDEWPAGVYDLAEVAGVPSAELWAAVNAQGTDFWASLEPTPWARSLVSYAKTLGRVVILSAPSLSPLSHAGKARWLAGFFGERFDAYVLTPNKSLLAGPRRVLVDDHDGHAAAFEDAGGGSVLLPARWNQRHAYASQPFAVARAELCAWHGSTRIPSPNVRRVEFRQ